MEVVLGAPLARQKVNWRLIARESPTESSVDRHSRLASALRHAMNFCSSSVPSLSTCAA